MSRNRQYKYVVNFVYIHSYKELDILKMNHSIAQLNSKVDEISLTWVTVPVECEFDVNPQSSKTEVLRRKRGKVRNVREVRALS